MSAGGGQIVEPDGTITLPLLGQVRAAGATLDELRSHLDDLFRRQIKDPRITVTPIDVKRALTHDPIHIATRMMTSAFKSAYDSLSSPAGAPSG